jgi:hypothetical protein
MGLSFKIAAGPHQRSHSQVRVPRDSWPPFTVSDSRLPQLGGPGPRIYIPQEKGGPVIHPGTGFPFRRLLRLAGLRWRYSTSPPHGIWHSLPESESELLYDWRFTADQFVLATSPLRPHGQQFFFRLNTCFHSPYVTSFLTREWGLLLTSAAGHRQRSHSRIRLPRDSWPYFTLSNWRLSQPEGPGPRIYSSRTGWPNYTPRCWVPFSRRLLRLSDSLQLFNHLRAG